MHRLADQDLTAPFWAKIADPILNSRLSGFHLSDPVGTATPTRILSGQRASVLRVTPMPWLPLPTAALLACILCLCTGEQHAQHADDAHAVPELQQEFDLRGTVCSAASGVPAAAMGQR